MCRSCGGALAASRPHVGGVMRCAGAYGRPWRVHARPPLLRSMQALAQWLHCASCILHRPGGVLLRQNPATPEISDARFRAIYSGMRKLPPRAPVQNRLQEQQRPSRTVSIQLCPTRVHPSRPCPDRRCREPLPVYVTRAPRVPDTWVCEPGEAAVLHPGPG